jgi:formylmethanofuran dehydrogenase subunit A
MQNPVKIDDTFRHKFRDTYSIEYENYPIDTTYLKHPNPIAVQAKV